ncbi:MAG: hypothetical protein JXN59_15255, partial [Anaerolineae bacterium]|nr:hypothetical protein [Anaerolineae bacterium]
GTPVRVAAVGGGPLRDVAWNAARSAVIVRLADGRTVIAHVNGSVLDVTQTVGAASLFWAE